jgi:hypothetical protein
MKPWRLFILFVCLSGGLLAGCRSAQPTAIASVPRAASHTPRPSQTLTGTPSPEPTHTPTWTQTPSSTLTLTPSPTDDPLAALRLTRLDRYTDIHPVEQVALQTAGWSRYTFDPLDARCIYGDDYFVLARPGRDPTKTVFWMEGGGACWPGQEACANHGRISPWVEEDGWASQDDRNPLREWNFVSLPSCDGSFYMGDEEADYDGNGQVEHTHWGLRNTSAAAALMRNLFPASEKILIAGCSAGGYGTLVAAPVIRLLFPEARLYVLNESGPGLFDPSQIETWRTIQEVWGLDTVFPADCPRCGSQLIYLYPWMLSIDPNLRVGLYSSYQDAVIGGIYLGMTLPAYEALLMSTTNEIRAEYPDTFQRFFVQGSGHCVTDAAYQVNGVSLYDWVEALVTDDPGWEDVLE